MLQLLAEFECGSYRFAISASKVRRVLPSAQPVPLPGAPDIVLGLLNIGGEVVIILNFCARVGLSSSAIGINQQLLLVDVAEFCVGLLVDRVSGVIQRNIEHPSFTPESFASAEYVQAILKLDDGLCVICDPEKLLLEKEKIVIGHTLEAIQNA